MNRTLTAQELRKRSTPAERHLWAQLRAHRLNGYYFRRQYPIGRYVVDSVKAVDYAPVQGFVVVAAFTFSIINFAVDVIYAFLDPRIKVS